MEHATHTLKQALILSKEIEKYPRESLTDFKCDLESISETYRRITDDVKAEINLAQNVDQYDPRSSSSAASSLASIRPNSANLVPSPTPSTPQLEVRAILEYALRSRPLIREAAWRFETPHTPTIKESLRALHIQSILSLQKQRTRVEKSSPERILVLCASRSLALDFQTFETRAGWRPKEVQVVERILRGEDVAIQKIGKTVKNFVAAHRFDMKATQRKLEAALRFGIKLGVIDAIGRELQLNSLSLLLGFEFVRISRLSFSALGILRQELQSEERLEEIQAFNRVMDPWWQQCQLDYHNDFGHSLPAGHQMDSGLHNTHVQAPPTLLGQTSTEPNSVPSDHFCRDRSALEQDATSDITFSSSIETSHNLEDHSAFDERWSVDVDAIFDVAQIQPFWTPSSTLPGLNP